jgi:Trk K+ transport system NAD-binding subunit
VQRIVTRVNDMSNRERFDKLGVKVIDPASAIVSLVDQTVRAPQATAMMMHELPDSDITQVTITSPDVHGMLLRDLRLPTDTLVLNVARNGQSIVPHGYTKLQKQDEVTLVGSPQSLEDVTRRLGF